MELRTVVADTAALVSLAVPKADERYDDETDPDPLRALLSSCTVSVPEQVVDELRTIAGYDDLDAAAARNVLAATAYRVEDPTDRESLPDELPSYGLGSGETAGILLADDFDADAFLTDEFGTGDYATIHALLDLDGPALLTTPRLIRAYARNGHWTPGAARTVLDEIARHRWGESSYVQQIRRRI